MMESASIVADRGTDWLDANGPEHEIVLSTRVRVARNLQGFPFSIRAGAEDRRRVLGKVREVIAAGAVLRSPVLLEMERLEGAERRLLLERHLASRDLIGGSSDDVPPGAALVLQGRHALGLMVNEEDHIRMQTLLNGLQPARAWEEVSNLDEELGHRLPWAFHHEFGFLTSCPTNVGTGLRASVLIHLPGLVLTKEIQKVLQGISQVGLTYRGLYGEGSEVVGNFFQISNQTTLGKTEEELIDHLAKIVGQVIQYEKQARAILLREAPTVLEDKVGRAYGILRHAHSLPFDEMMNLISGVRLGITLKLLRTPRVETLNRVMIYGQTAHLEHAAGRSLDESDADVHRAAFVRRALVKDEETARSSREGDGEPEDVEADGAP